jgi:hypothetical protein
MGAVARPKYGVWRKVMRNIIYLVGLVVVVLFILSLLGIA